MTKKKPGVRVTVDMSPEFYERFEELEELVGSASKAELIRQALQAYDYLARRQGAGWHFTAVSESGEEESPVFVPLPMPWQTRKSLEAD